MRSIQKKSLRQNDADKFENRGLICEMSHIIDISNEYITEKDEFPYWPIILHWHGS